MCLLLNNRNIILVGLIVALSQAASPQTGGKLVRFKADALKEVSVDKRTRLVERLELYVRSTSTSDLDQIYALMPQACTHGYDKTAWRKRVHVKPSGLLRAFDVDAIYAGNFTLVANVDGEKWIATGCGTYQRGNKTVTYKASINLVLSGDEWYVCGSGIAIEGKHDTPMPCDGT